MIHSINQVVLFAGLATLVATIAAAWDIKCRRIPNVLTFSAFAIAMLLRAALTGWKGELSGLAAGLVAGTIFLIFHIAGGMGAGDVKLITVLGVLYGFAGLPYLLVFTSIAGGAMAVVLAMMHGRLRETFTNMGTLAVHHVRTGLSPHEDLNVNNKATLRLPYGLAIAVGCLLTNFTLLG